MVRTALFALALLASSAAHAGSNSETCVFDPKGKVSLRLTYGVVGGKHTYYSGKIHRERFERMLLACGMTESAKTFRQWRAMRRATNITLGIGLPTGYLLPIPMITALIATADRDALRHRIQAELTQIPARKEPPAGPNPWTPQPPTSPPKPEPEPKPEPPSPAVAGWAGLDLDAEQTELLASIRKDLEATAEMLYLRIRAERTRNSIEEAQRQLAELDAVTAAELAKVPNHPVPEPIAPTLDELVKEAGWCAQEAQLATEVDVARAANRTCTELFEPARHALTEANERLKLATAARRAEDDARAARLAWESRQGQRDNASRALLLSGAGLVAAGVVAGIEGHQNRAYLHGSAYAPGIALGVVGVGLGASSVVVAQQQGPGILRGRGR